ncbi:unnamed protein product [Bursaphelenchus okinawaensis]|uniref:Major facilitator superfamily (MFS) profile domain-containing protein n=1 Tax=Bursaphelenchus okinawaensis TaxID=465554 RepID=A0A811JQZ9_9BILA|nr:unnamed protein product [Bursaphelenchus okinawaensis]CAG9079426.1 unnamed protein product [Bursaphelenchus okinawaensis]
MDRLEEFDKWNPYIIWIFTSMTFTWCITAAPMMITAFIVGQVCPPDTNCTSTLGTLMEEFDLTGDKAHLAGIATSMYLFGNMVGACTVARLADLIGRRPLIIVNVFILGVVGLISATSSSIYEYIALRFVQGIFFPGCGIVSWVLAYESMGMFWRSYAAFFFGLAWVIGYCIVGPLAYLIPYWRHLVVVASFPSCILGVIYWFTIPESYHYMVSKGKSIELNKWLQNVNRFKQETELSAEDLINEHLKHQKSDGTENKTFLVQLISHKRILLYTMVLSYLWVCDTFVYYGLSLFSTELAGDKFWNYILSGFIELPSYAVSPYLLDKIGRRLFVSAAHFLAGFSFLATIFINHPTMSLIFWLMGKFGISCAFTCLFVYASEVFPTNLRSGCIGACEILARLGGVFAPQANELKFVYEKLPMIFFTIVAGVGGAVTLILPETKGQNLPDTICEAENRRKISQRQHTGTILSNVD